MALSKVTVMSFLARGEPGVFLKNQKDCGQAAMTERDDNVALLMTLLAGGIIIIQRQ